MNYTFSSENSPGTVIWRWRKMRIEDFKVPSYCVRAGYSLDGGQLYVGKVKGHIGNLYLNSPAKIRFGISDREDRISFTFGGKEYDASQPTVNAQVDALVCSYKTVISVGIREIDTKFEGAVEVNCDQICKDNELFISRYFYWLPPDKVGGSYVPFEAGLHEVDGELEPLYLGRTSIEYENPVLRHVPGKVVLSGNGDRAPGIYIGDGTREIRIPKHEAYEVLALGPKRILDSERERARRSERDRECGRKKCASPICPIY